MKVISFPDTPASPRYFLIVTRLECNYLILIQELTKNL